MPLCNRYPFAHVAVLQDCIRYGKTYRGQPSKQNSALTLSLSIYSRNPLQKIGQNAYVMQARGSSKSENKTNTAASVDDDLEREVYGVLGVPIDNIDITTALGKIRTAAAKRRPFLISTANLNFLATSQVDAEFRTSLLQSELCTADGMPIVWIARLLGIPVRERVAGSDIFEELKLSRDPNSELKVFLFGGAEGVAESACKNLNSRSGGLTCVGSLSPGFASVEEMSVDSIFDHINSSGADFLAAALGAKKGQTWLLRNHDRIKTPVRVHLGATVNFQAGTVQRAPTRVRKLGLEWLWRIKEEPHLWRRYWGDGLVFLRLLLTRVVPLMVIAGWASLKRDKKSQGLNIEKTEDDKTVILSLNGAAVASNIGNITPSLQAAVAVPKDIVINFSNTSHIDARFLGLLSMLNKQLGKRRLKLTCARVPRRVERIFRLSGFQFLLGQS